MLSKGSQLAVTPVSLAVLGLVVAASVMRSASLLMIAAVMSLRLAAKVSLVSHTTCTHSFEFLSNFYIYFFAFL